MTGLVVVLIVVVIEVLKRIGLAIPVVTQYEMGVQFRFGRLSARRARAMPSSFPSLTSSPR